MKTATAIALLASVSLGQASPAGKYSQLASWEGRYPSNGMTPAELTAESTGRNGPARSKRNFFKIPEINRTLRQLLTEKDYNRITKTLAVETPIERVDNYLAVEVGENALALVALRDDNVLAIIFEASGARDQEQPTACHTTGVQLSALSDAIKERVLESYHIRMYAGEKLLPKHPWIDRMICNVRPRAHSQGVDQGLSLPKRQRSQKPRVKGLSRLCWFSSWS